MPHVFHRTVSPPPTPAKSPRGGWNARVPLWVLLEVFVAFLSVRQRVARRRHAQANGREQ